MNVSIHNIKAIQIHGRDHDDFCTLNFIIQSQSKFEKNSKYDVIELYFDTTADRKFFIETISEAGV